MHRGRRDGGVPLRSAALRIGVQSTALLTQSKATLCSAHERRATAAHKWEIPVAWHAARHALKGWATARVLGQLEYAEYSSCGGAGGRTTGAQPCARAHASGQLQLQRLRLRLSEHCPWAAYALNVLLHRHPLRCAAAVPARNSGSQPVDRLPTDSGRNRFPCNESRVVSHRAPLCLVSKPCGLRADGTERARTDQPL
jgi:hypothetical protein